MTVDGANVIKADIITDNGVIHVIDAVMLPKS
ncbi:MAG: fasciclin domain-containing protein [Rhizobiaceae bacterium]